MDVILSVGGCPGSAKLVWAEGPINSKWYNSVLTITCDKSGNFTDSNGIRAPERRLQHVDSYCNNLHAYIEETIRVWVAKYSHILLLGISTHRWFVWFIKLCTVSINKIYSCSEVNTDMLFVSLDMHYGQICKLCKFTYHFQPCYSIDGK